MSTVGFMFPGQGTQHRGMGRWMQRASPAAAEVFTAGSAVLGRDLHRLCFVATDTELTRTDNAQIAVFTVNAAAAALLAERGVRPGIVAGHSVGELNALCQAGSLSLADGFRLVAARGALMAAVTRPGTMAMVLGLAPAAVETEIDAVLTTGAGPLVTALINGASNVVVSGTGPAVTAVTGRLTARGGRVVALRVGGAFHSPLMAEAGEQWRDVLAATVFAPARVPVVLATTGTASTDPGVLRQAALDQLTMPVQWIRAMRTAVAGADDLWMIEAGASKMLTALLRDLHPAVSALSLWDPRSLARLPAVVA